MSNPNVLGLTGGVLSSTNPGFHAFGWDAKHLTVRNRAPVSIYLNLNSTAASTSDFQVLSSGEWKIENGGLISRLALHATATSTSADKYDLLAVGD